MTKIERSHRAAHSRYYARLADEWICEECGQPWADAHPCPCGHPPCLGPGDLCVAEQAERCMGSWADIHCWVHPACTVPGLPHQPHDVVIPPGKGSDE